jgi:anaerobic selenocysteine-containing dehydrogenase
LIRQLEAEGDQFQYGGPHLCWGWNFPTDDGKAHFAEIHPSEKENPPGMFVVTTRRGRQFNSIIQGTRDGLTGAERDAILISGEDADALEIRDDDPLILTSETGQYQGRALIAPVKPGSLQIHWPEGEVLIDHIHRARAGAPDYNALVSVTRREPSGVG